MRILLVTMKEWYSSQTCFGCGNHVTPIAHKHKRMYYCETCGKSAHRDTSAAIVHLKIARMEVEGVRNANGPNPLAVTHTRRYSEDDVVHFYRDKIYIHSAFTKEIPVPLAPEGMFIIYIILLYSIYIHTYYILLAMILYY